MMRLLYVCNDFGISPAGTKGAAVHVRAITRALADLGHEVWLLSPKEGPGQEHPARRLIPPGCPPAAECAGMLKHFLLEHGLGDAIARDLRPLLYSAWVRQPALDAIGSTRFDAVIERLSLFSYVGIDLAETLSVPLLIEVNAILTEEARAFRALALHELAETMQRRVVARADAVMVVSQPLAEQAAAWGASRERIHVIPNGADVTAFEQAPPREACRIALGLGEEFVVGFLGSLKVWHGVDVLLAAFARVREHEPAARLLIVGSGPAEADLRSSANRLNIADAVIFTGAVPHERVPALLGAMDVAVAPFKDIAGFYFSPIKLFEYMASGACVVASRLGQIRDVIEDGVNGLLCRPDDVDDLLAQLERARQSPELRRQLAANASDTVRRRFTWSHAAEKTVQAIRRALADRTPPAGDPLATPFSPVTALTAASAPARAFVS